MADSNGKRVNYVNGRLSNNAPNDLKRYINYLDKTATGREIMNNMINSPVRIRVKFTDKSANNSRGYGYTDMRMIKRKIKGIEKIVYTADVYIYEDIISNETELYNQEGVYSNSDVGKKRIEMQPTTDELTESVCAHEGVHSTDTQNLSQKPEDIQQREVRANEAEIKVINEIIERKQQSKEPKQ